MDESFNWRWLALLVAFSLLGGFVYSDYGVPGALLVIPFVMPIAISVLVFRCSERIYMRFIIGFGALAVLDTIRWLAWVDSVGSEFAHSDEQTFGMAKATAVIHVLVFVISVAIGLAWHQRGRSHGHKP